LDRSEQPLAHSRQFECRLFIFFFPITLFLTPTFVARAWRGHLAPACTLLLCSLSRKCGVFNFIILLLNENLIFHFFPPFFRRMSSDPTPFIMTPLRILLWADGEKAGGSGALPFPGKL
jgi:hypothetical protein